MKHSKNSNNWSDTFNDTKNIDIVIPANNKGVKSLATLFWLLAREYKKEVGDIIENKEFNYSIEDFAGGKILEEEKQ